MNNNMNILEIDINKLIFPKYNPRKKLKPDDKEYQKIKKSIEEFGYTDLVIINKDNTIISGNQRTQVLMDMGYKKIKVVQIDIDKTKEKALNIALNKITGEWDYAMLGDLLLDLDSQNYDLEITGFDLDEIEDILAPIGEEKEVIEDDFDCTPPEEPKAKYGDIYQLGNHYLMCGDSTKEEDVAKLMDGNKADMVFTDPPYGYKYQSNMRTKTDKFDVLINDDKILDFMKPLKQVADGFVFICTTWKVLDKWLPLFNKYYDLSNMIIWNKGGGGIGDLKHTFSTDYEIILCSNNGNEITGKRIGSVWNIQKDNANDYIHATQKPVELSATAIKNTTNEDDNVLDLFGGSGSTLIACEQLNRNCYMMELDEHYIDVIIQRWENFTGKKAVLLNDSGSN